MSEGGFGSRVVEEIGFYIYSLIDPRSNEPFYIGKGHGMRVFSHEFEADLADITSEKLERIRNIKAEGHEVQKVILRHGMTEKESLLAESVLIDFVRAYGNDLTNIAAGHHTNAFGIMTTDEVRRKYMAQPLEQLEEGCVVININGSYRNAKNGGSYYHATRGSWVMADWRITGLKYALSEFRGFVVEVFEIDPDGWRKEPDSKRWTFTGGVAPDDVRQRYLNKRIPKKKGEANPIKYRL